MVSWFFLLLSVLNFSANIPKRTHDFLIVFDVSLSMNARDMMVDGELDSRISFVRISLVETLKELPCGTKIGIGIFAGYQTSILYKPVEACLNYSDLIKSFSFIETNMIWAGDSEISKGIYNSIKMLDKVDPNVRLVFITDGHEAPPIAAAYRPRFDQPKNKIEGLIVGVGGQRKIQIPKINSDGDEIGFWLQEEVMQYDPFTTGRKGSDANEKLVDNESSLVDPGLIAALEASPGLEHLTNLRERYLKLLASELNFDYQRLDSGEVLAKKMTEMPYSEWRDVSTILSSIFAALSLFFLFIAFFPRMTEKLKLFP